VVALKGIYTNYDAPEGSLLNKIKTFGFNEQKIYNLMLQKG
jgi:hypothetical protein